MILTARLREAHHGGIARYDRYIRQNAIPHTVDDVVGRLAGGTVVERRISPAKVLYYAYIGGPAQYVRGFCADLFSSTE